MFPTSLFPERISRETVELRDIIESGVKLWDFDYPSYYKDQQKTDFESKVTEHFWTRQIGQETVGRFLLYFRRTMREIMPYYIQRYESEAKMKELDDPFGNVDIVETFEQDVTGSSEATDTATSESNNQQSTMQGGVNARSETPQKTLMFDLSLSGNVTLAHASELEQNKAQQTGTETVTGTSTNTGSASNTQKVKHTLTRKGNQGVSTYAHDMNELRQSFLNIDMEIIQELESCFMGVY